MTTATVTADRIAASTPAAWPFYLGAAVDIVLGFDLLVFTDWIAGTILPGGTAIAGIALPAVLRGIGVVLLVIGLETAVMARNPVRWRQGLWVIAGLNVVAAASAIADLLFAVAMLSAAGIPVMVAVAAGCLGLTALQVRALRAGA